MWGHNVPAQTTIKQNPGKTPLDYIYTESSNDFLSYPNTQKQKQKKLESF